MANLEYVLETKNICKSYGKTIALKNANLQFEDEKIYGMYGRNGPGKTTLVSVILLFSIFFNQLDYYRTCNR